MIAAQRFRLARIDTPEIRSRNKAEKEAGLVAKQYVIDAFAQAKGVCEIESIKTGKFGRWLAEIYINGINLNNELVATGLAKEYHGGKRPKA